MAHCVQDKIVKQMSLLFLIQVINSTPVSRKIFSKVTKKKKKTHTQTCRDTDTLQFEL